MNKQKTVSLLERTRFVAHWEASGGNHSRAFEVLCAHYSESHRHYHNAEHIAAGLQFLDQCIHLAIKPSDLILAWYFHDVIYEPTGLDNEEKSADLFTELAVSAGLSPSSIRRIRSLITSTKNHYGISFDAQLLADIDLVILVATSQAYTEFESQIREEYSIYPIGLYRSGRLAVLRRFLERPRIFATPWFATRFETQARNNLTRAIKELESQNQEKSTCSNS